RPPPRELPAEGRRVQAGELPQGRVLPAPPPGVPRTRPALLAGTTPVVRLVLRRFRPRRTAQHREAVHRAAEPAALTRVEVNSANPCTQLRSEQFSGSLHHRAEARCTANSPGSQWSCTRAAGQAQ